MRKFAVLAAALALAPAATAAPLTVRTSFEDGTILFGDATAAVVTVTVDTEVVDPESVRVEADVAPLSRTGPVSTDRSETGDLVTFTHRAPVVCASDACRPRGELRTVSLPRVRVTAADKASRRLAAHTAWPPLLLASRVPATAAAGEPAWRVDTRPPTVSYRVSPALLAALLRSAAALLALTAAALVAWELGRRRRRGAAAPDELEAALADLRAALDADVRARRRAAGRLARVLRRRRDERSDAAAALAWNEPEPEPARLVEFAGEVERGIRA